MRIAAVSLAACVLVSGAGVGVAAALVPAPQSRSVFGAETAAALSPRPSSTPRASDSASEDWERNPDRPTTPTATPEPPADAVPGTPEAALPAPEPEPEPAPAPPAPPAPGTTPVPPPPATPAPPPPAAGGRPSAANTGVPAGTALRRYDGDIVITTPGTVIDSLDVYGLIYVQAANVTIRRTIVHGRPISSSASLINANYPSVSNLLIEDVELVAEQPSPSVGGITGLGFTLRRVNIHGVIDQVHVTGGNVRIEASFLHDNLHYDQDPNWGGKPSHDDNVQVQAGNGVVITGNSLSGSGNAALMVTQDAGVVANLAFTGNWAAGGACTVNIAQKARGPIGGLTVTGNRFGKSKFNCPLIVDAPTAAIANISGNSMDSGGPALLQRR